MRFNRKTIVTCSAVLAASLAFTLSSCTQHRPPASAPVVSVAASSAPLEFGLAVRALKFGSEGDGEVKLARIRAEYPDTLWAGRASFLSGVRAVERGEAGAAEMFEGAGALERDIPEYLAFYRARAYAIDGEHARALSVLELLINDYPASPLLVEALFLRASSLMALGRSGEASYAFESIAEAHPESALAPRALLRAAEARFAIGDVKSAGACIKKIYIEYPASEAAPATEKLVELNPGEGLAKELALTPLERRRRAWRFFRDARFEEAAGEYMLLAADRNSPFYGTSVLQGAVSMVRLKRYEEAASMLEGYLKSVKRGSALERKALYWSALVSLRQGSEKGLRAAVDSLSSRHPRSGEQADALLFLGRYYESRSMEAEAVAAYTRVMDGFADTETAREAAWHTGWIHYRAGRYDKALRIFSVNSAPASGGPGMFLYWRARSVEKTGDGEEAERLYRRLCSESFESYYCRMAEKRLGEDARRLTAQGGGQDAVRKNPVSPRFESTATGLTSSARYRAVMELLTLGLDGWAAEETALLAREFSKEPASLAELAGLFYLAGDFHSAYRLYYSYLPGQSDLTALSFPPRLVDQLRRKGPAGQAGSVDPYLVAAVMREESGFNPGAVSSTGAMGLMQIMPSTGKYIAGKLGRELGDERELLDPEVNVELGSWYLAHLARRFDNDMVLTIASYNAGPSAVARWTETLPVELDEFIESIPYPETRRYAKKVLQSYGEFLRTDGVDPAGLLARPVLDTPGPDEVEASTVAGDGRS